MRTMHMRTLRTAMAGLAFALAVLLVGCGGSSSANGGGSGGSNPGGCVAEVRDINGVSTCAFCGAATGQATVNGATWTWTKGECFKESGMVGVNIGRVILGTGAAADQLKKQYDYLGVTVQASADGTVQGVAVDMVHAGQDLALANSTVTLNSGLTKGTFTGTPIAGGAPISGSWSC